MRVALESGWIWPYIQTISEQSFLLGYNINLDPPDPLFELSIPVFELILCSPILPASPILLYPLILIYETRFKVDGNSLWFAQPRTQSTVQHGGCMMNLTHNQIHCNFTVSSVMLACAVTQNVTHVIHNTGLRDVIWQLKRRLKKRPLPKWKRLHRRKSEVVKIKPGRQDAANTTHAPWKWSPRWLRTLDWKLRRQVQQWLIKNVPLCCWGPFSLLCIRRQFILLNH